LLNKFQVKVSEQAKEILLQFFKFENLVLLMQVANSSIDFRICTERNIVDLKTVMGKIGQLDAADGSILLPFEQVEARQTRVQEDLILGRLPEFCPEAFQLVAAPVGVPQSSSSPVSPGAQTAGGPPVDARRARKSHQVYNILHEPQIPLPHLDPILKEKIEKQLTSKANLHKTLPSIGQITLQNTYRQVNCVTISDSGAVMASGLDDSTIKVFVLSKKQHDVLTVEDMIREQVTINLKQTDDASNLEKNGIEVHTPEEKKEKPGKKKRGAAEPAEEVAAAEGNEKKGTGAKDADSASEVKDTDEYELVGHTGPVFAVSISICDKHLLSGSYDNTIRRWSLQTKGPLMVYYGHSFPVWDVKFSPLGSYFASCSADRTAKLWILKNSSPLRIFASQGGHLNDVEAIEFHPNMHYLASASSDRQIILWDVQTGSQARNFQTMPGAVRSLKFNRAGTHLFAGNDNGEVVIFDLVQNLPIDVIQTKQDKAIWTMDISWDDAVLALGTESGSIELYSVPKLIQNAGRQLQTLIQSAV
jgi:WD40 repeat protein